MRAIDGESVDLHIKFPKKLIPNCRLGEHAWVLKEEAKFRGTIYGNDGGQLW